MTVAAILAAGCLLAGTLAGLDVSDRTLEIADATDVQVSAASGVRIGRDGVIHVSDVGDPVLRRQHGVAGVR